MDPSNNHYLAKIKVMKVSHLGSAELAKLKQILKIIFFQHLIAKIES